MAATVRMGELVLDREWPAHPMHPERVPKQLTLTATDLEARPWRSLADQPGIRERVLWEDPASGASAAILELAPGAEIGDHFHRRIAHHYFVLSGTCEVSHALRVLGPGSYAVAEPGMTHGIERVGPEGCRIFFLQTAV